MIVPTEKTLTAEILSRLKTIHEKQEEIKRVDTPESAFVSTVIDYEKQILIEMHGLVMHYARQGAKEEVDGITPIKDMHGTLLCIGDKVKKINPVSGERCGYLEWDEYRNQYCIRTDSGGKILIDTCKLEKIDELFNFSIDTTQTECRQRPNKKKW